MLASDDIDGGGQDRKGLVMVCTEFPESVGHLTSNALD